LPLPGAVSVVFRTREDFRWLDTGFSARLRERMQVQRNFTNRQLQVHALRLGRRLFRHAL
jgi:hypothetical protein